MENIIVGIVQGVFFYGVYAVVSAYKRNKKIKKGE